MVLAIDLSNPRVGVWLICREVLIQMNTQMRVRSVQASDFGAWKALYSGYKQFYAVTPVAGDLRVTFDWILDENHPQNGVVLEDQGVLVGLANYQVQANPLTARDRMYLNDLFVAPARRGEGFGRMLLEALIGQCQARGYESLRWLTAENNTTARILYDKHATAIAFVPYEVRL